MCIGKSENMPAEMPFGPQALSGLNSSISFTICCTGVNLNHVLRRAEDLLNCFVSATHCKQSRRPVRFQNMNRQLFKTDC